MDVATGNNAKVVFQDSEVIDADIVAYGNLIRVNGEVCSVKFDYDSEIVKRYGIVQLGKVSWDGYGIVSVHENDTPIYQDGAIVSV